jgi:hypothetical protein
LGAGPRGSFFGSSFFVGSSFFRTFKSGFWEGLLQPALPMTNEVQTSRRRNLLTTSPLFNRFFVFPNLRKNARNICQDPSFRNREVGHSKLAFCQVGYWSRTFVKEIIFIRHPRSLRPRQSKGGYTGYSPFLIIQTEQRNGQSVRLRSWSSSWRRRSRLVLRLDSIPFLSAMAVLSAASAAM